MPTTRTPLVTMTALRKLAKADPNSHWFDPNAMSYFNSTVHGKTWMLDTNHGLFISREQFEQEPALYTLREFRIDGDSVTIDTYGELGAYSTLSRAIDAAIEAVAH